MQNSVKKLLNVSILLVITMNMLNIDLKADWFTTSDVRDVFEFITENIPSGARVFIDVDDTLITPQSNLFRDQSAHKNIIDMLKKDLKEAQDAGDVEKSGRLIRSISSWRLRRKSMLVAREWPSVIQYLKQDYVVYGLTKMDTGSFGAISSMEQWRYNELASHNLLFSGSRYMYGSPKRILQDASYFSGIFMTGSHTKGDVIKASLEQEGSLGIVLIDDREEHLLDVAWACAALEIPFWGILFQAASLLPGVLNVSRAQKQIEYLVHHEQWLEDDEVDQVSDR